MHTSRCRRIPFADSQAFLASISMLTPLVFERSATPALNWFKQYLMK